LISYLHDRGLTPGSEVMLASAPASASQDETVDLHVAGQKVAVPARVAYALWVVPLA
jgi:hypothetical protein